MTAPSHTVMMDIVQVARHEVLGGGKVKNQEDSKRKKERKREREREVIFHHQANILFLSDDDDSFLLSLRYQVAVHCHAGFGRTGIVVACLLVALDWCAGLEAVRIVRKQR